MIVARYARPLLLVVVSLFVMMAVTAVVWSHSAHAVNIDEACSNAGSSSLCDARGENIEDNFAKNLTNLLLFVLGTAAVIMIVIGGIKYASANGDSSKIASAKNTILYSVVGLVVALMAWGIIRFIVEQFSS